MDNMLFNPEPTIAVAACQRGTACVLICGRTISIRIIDMKCVYDCVFAAVKNYVLICIHSAGEALKNMCLLIDPDPMPF